MTTVELVRAYLDTYFVEQQPDKLFELLTEDYCSYGISGSLRVQGGEQGRALLRDERYRQYTDCTLTIIKEEAVSEECAVVSYTLTNAGITLEYRLMGVSRMTAAGRRLYLVEHAAVTPPKSDNMFADALAEQRSKMLTGLLNASFTGGAMGGYLAPGYPFYYINQSMLDYLGYRDEAEFVQDIGGLIGNGMHPDERDAVDAEVERQLADNKVYQVEYRMRRRDGDYVWVHDIGQITKAEDGREVILSVCYDITSAKEHTLLIENLVDTMQGGMALYKVGAGLHLTPYYMSAGVGALSHRTNEEYRVLCERDSMCLVYRKDVERVSKAHAEALQKNKVTSCTYRVLDKLGGYVWINALFSRYEEIDGTTVLRAVFTPTTLQHELQIQALEQNDTGIIVLDGETEEIYYANDASFAIHGRQPRNYAGLRCYEVFDEGAGCCAACWRRGAGAGEETGEHLMEKQGRILSIHFEWRDWNGRRVLVEYLRDVTAQTMMERRLRENEIINETACRFAGLWTFSFEIDTGRMLSNASLQSEQQPHPLGRFPEDHLSFGVVLPEYHARYYDALRGLRDGAREVEFEAEVVYPDGNKHWIRVRINRVEDPLLRNFAVGSALPIDEEKALEGRIELERRKQSVYDPALTRYLVVNISRDEVVEQRVFRGDIAVPAEGMTMAELLEATERYAYHDESWREYCALHDKERLIALFANGTETLEVEGRHWSGSEYIWLRNKMNLLREPATNDLYLYEYAYDINDQKCQAQILGAAVDLDYERLSSVNLVTGQMIRIFGRGERSDIRLQESDYKATYTEYCSSQIAAADREEFLRNISLPVVKAELEKYGVYRFTHRAMKGGEVRYKRNRFMYYDAENQLVLMTRTDVTSLVREEAEKRQELQAAKEAAEAASRAKSEFLSRMSHEIRTPMNAIMGMTAIAQENRGDDQQVGECLARIDTSSRFLLTLINDILEMSRIESGRLEIRHEAFCFEELIESIRIVVEPLAQKSGLRYEFLNGAGTEKRYLGDKVRIQQVMVNLIGNAIKFTKPDGWVRFSVYIDSETAARTAFRFVVSDSGIGMTEGFMERMFTPFTQEDASSTSEYGGSGLGLAISKSLVEAMGGKIAAESLVGVGSTFTVTLPLERIETVEPQTAQPVQPEDLDSLQGRKILMAEDHPLNVVVACKLLERRGLQVTVADNGKRAVEAFEASELGYYDAILMDLRMPVMDGLDAARAIRALNRHDAKTVPIIAMTANALEEDRRNTQAAGMNEHLAKPFEPMQLYGVLARQIAQREQ